MTSRLNRRRRVALLLLTCTAVVTFAAPASAAQIGAGPAAPTYRPDGQIAVACEYVPDWYGPCNPNWTGDNVYNTTGKNQKRSYTDYLQYGGEPDPRVIVFRILIQNDGSVADRFRVDADGVTTGYVVKFFRKSTNVTSAVDAGTYATGVIAPGASVVLKAKVVMPCPSHDDCGRDRAYDIAQRLVTIRSVGDPLTRDAVKFVRKPWVCTC